MTKVNDTATRRAASGLADDAMDKLCAFIRVTDTNPQAKEAFIQCLANEMPLIDCNMAGGVPVFFLNQQLATYLSDEVTA